MSQSYEPLPVEALALLPPSLLDQALRQLRKLGSNNSQAIIGHRQVKAWNSRDNQPLRLDFGLEGTRYDDPGHAEEQEEAQEQRMLKLLHQIKDDLNLVGTLYKAFSQARQIQDEKILKGIERNVKNALNPFDEEAEDDFS